MGRTPQSQYTRDSDSSPAGLDFGVTTSSDEPLVKAWADGSVAFLITLALGLGLTLGCGERGNAADVPTWTQNDAAGRVRDYLISVTSGGEIPRVVLSTYLERSLGWQVAYHGDGLWQLTTASWRTEPNNVVWFVSEKTGTVTPKDEEGAAMLACLVMSQTVASRIASTICFDPERTRPVR